MDKKRVTKEDAVVLLQDLVSKGYDGDWGFMLMELSFYMIYASDMCRKRGFAATANDCEKKSEFIYDFLVDYGYCQGKGGR